MPRWRRVYYGWVIAVALAIAQTVSWGIVYYSFSVFLVPMEAELGASRAQLSLAFTLALLVSGVAALPVGRWIDTHGARALMTAGSLAAVALIWAWSRAASLAGLYLIFAGLGLTMAAVLYDPAFAVIVAWFQRQRRRALTLLTVVAGLASTIFVPLSGWLLAQVGWRQALAILAVVLLATTVPLHALILRRRPQDLGLLPDGEAQPAQPAASAPLPAQVPAATLGASFWLMTAAFVLSSGVSVATSVHFISYLIGRGHPATLAAALAGGIGLMQLPGRLLFEPVGRRLPRHWMNALVLASQGGAVLLLLGSPGILRLAAFVIVFGMVNGVLTLSRATAVAELFGSQRYASISGMMSFWITPARAAGPTVLALLYAAAGGRYEPGWVLAAAAMLVAAAAYAGAERRHRTSPRPAEQAR
jgi:predicted MFS family arabinose efflux permease